MEVNKMVNDKSLGKMAMALSVIANEQSFYGYRKALAIAHANGFRTLAHAINAIATATNEKVVTKLNLNCLIIH